MTDSTKGNGQWISVLVVPGQRITSVKVVNRNDGEPMTSWLDDSLVYLSHTAGGMDQLCGNVSGVTAQTVITASSTLLHFDIDCATNTNAGVGFNWVTVFKPPTSNHQYLSINQIVVSGTVELTWYKGTDIELSSTYNNDDTYRAGNCNDGSVNGVICASSFGQNGANQWLKVDLGGGGRAGIKSVLVYNRDDLPSLAAYLGQYTIQVAIEGGDWVSCLTNNPTQTATASFGPFSTSCDQGDTVNIRYVRLLLPSAGESTSRFLSIHELVVLGSVPHTNPNNDRVLVE